MAQGDSNATPSQRVRAPRSQENNHQVGLLFWSGLSLIFCITQEGGSSLRALETPRTSGVGCPQSTPQAGFRGDKEVFQIEVRGSQALLPVQSREVQVNCGGLWLILFDRRSSLTRGSLFIESPPTVLARLPLKRSLGPATVPLPLAAAIKRSTMPMMGVLCQKTFPSTGEDPGPALSKKKFLW